VDCGVCDGDTLRPFLAISSHVFERYSAIEPDTRNVEKLHSLTAALPDGFGQKIEIIQAVVSDQPGELRFQSTGGTIGAISPDGDQVVRAISIDDSLKAISPTFIKMDIEGAEPLALQGSIESIRKNKPILALCIYHHPEHFWKIPRWVADLNLGYTLFIRSHGYGGLETVLYAIPPDRIISAHRDDAARASCRN